MKINGINDRHNVRFNVRYFTKAFMCIYSGIAVFLMPLCATSMQQVSDEALYAETGKPPKAQAPALKLLQSA